ncbi:ROK family transcriptional regulator [Streptacidiphilus jiangxiensis]|uniref:Sugar kinase of the NBD/HSP70 family, may contain an N-terminal HTH domain n=1 Tax=Streptacidiphilus jiangxiensis TaxID=235985 RepID=A0A1H7V9Q9_STRJI|nr:ROK family transcriptional regulator [Streptacidiphilus jiangxiensis]SEM06001.1 Sugar kinase of the NBD/HSP70 family, may contain an N-terminal HTH domain [Streptacidiphilus jiangxiensis]
MTDEGRRNVRDLRRANRARLLRQLYFHGPLSRQDLIQATGLSSASVSNVVADLLDAGLVVEAGAVESEGGRPRILLRVDTSCFEVIGIDVGETRIRLERFDLGLGELAALDVPVVGGSLDPESVVPGIASGLAELVAGAEAPVLGVGIGVPGIVQHQPFAVIHGQTVGWDAFPLEELLRKHTALPLFIDNGATTLAQAEMWFGAGRDVDSAVFLLLGSGAGASVIADGAPFRGSTTSAGEWGHLNVQYQGRLCRCGSRGCLEAYVGAEAIIARYQEAVDAAVVDAADEEGALRSILAEAQQAGPAGDAARAVLDETAVRIGIGIANVVNFLNPQRVIIGGWAGLALAPSLLPRIREVVREHALHLPYSLTSIDLGALGADAVALGAATLPVARFLEAGA